MLKTLEEEQLHWNFLKGVFVKCLLLASSLVGVANGLSKTLGLTKMLVEGLAVFSSYMSLAVSFFYTKCLRVLNFCNTQGS